MGITIGEKIKELRKKNNITQEKLAQYLNISCQAVSKWESNASLPDITYVIPISTFFGVTTDTLFDTNSKIISDEEILLNENYEKMKCINNYLEAIKLMESASFKYPRNYRFIFNLAEILYLSWRESHEDTQLNKSLELFERILDDCTDNNIRYDTMQQLVYVYCSMDNIEKAKNIVDALPSTPVCKDLLLERVLSGQELEKQMDINLEHFMFYIWLRLQKTAVSKMEQTTEDKIRAQEAAIQLYQLVYYDKNFGWYNCRIARNYINLMKIYAGEKNVEATLKSLAYALKYAKDYHDSFSQDIITKSIFCYEKNVSSSYLSNERKDSLIIEIRVLISKDEFKFLNGNEMFEELQSKIGDFID